MCPCLLRGAHPRSAEGRAGCRAPPRRSGMDRYRYFVFNQRNMVLLGLLQVAFSTLCVVSGFVDGVFGGESLLGRTRAPVWAGMVTWHPAFCPPWFPLWLPRAGRGRSSLRALPGFLLGIRAVLRAELPSGGARAASAGRCRERGCSRPLPPAGRASARSTAERQLFPPSLPPLLRSSEPDPENRGLSAFSLSSEPDSRRRLPLPTPFLLCRSWESQASWRCFPRRGRTRSL